MEEKQKIHCSVHKCDFCNETDNVCNLKEIKVCDCGSEMEKEATMCNSFKKKN